jgi:hypothetical protein
MDSDTTVHPSNSDARLHAMCWTAHRVRQLTQRRAGNRRAILVRRIVARKTGAVLEQWTVEGLGLRLVGRIARRSPMPADDASAQMVEAAQ